MNPLVRRLAEGVADEGLLFAWRHELAFPRMRVRYSYIPKNGCSSFKLSFGVAQGWLNRETVDPHGISIRHRIRGQVTTWNAISRFAVLRDPASRLVSAFLDRFSKENDHATDRLKAQGILQSGQAIGDVTFRQFCHFVGNQPNREQDAHWRPQVDFLYGEYTHYLDFSNMSANARWVESLGVPFREYRPHATSSYQSLGRPATDLTADQLRDLRLNYGLVPTREELLDEDVRDAVDKLYEDDYQLIANVSYVQ